MNKQEEIREGMQRLEFNFGFLSDEETSELLQYLHSQGCAIKVEGELPSIFNSNEDVISASKYKKKLSDYVKTESLIEEK